MATSLTKAGIKVVVLLLILTAVASCGRRGGLEAPPSASVQSQQSDTTDVNGADETAAEPVKEDNPFFLDPLL